MWKKLNVQSSYFVYTQDNISYYKYIFLYFCLQYVCITQYNYKQKEKWVEKSRVNQMTEKYFHCINFLNVSKIQKTSKNNSKKDDLITKILSTLILYIYFSFFWRFIAFATWCMDEVHIIIECVFI